MKDLNDYLSLKLISYTIGMSLEFVGKMKNYLNMCKSFVVVTLPIRMENWSFGDFSNWNYVLVSVLPRKKLIIQHRLVPFTVKREKMCWEDFLIIFFIEKSAVSHHSLSQADSSVTCMNWVYRYIKPKALFPSLIGWVCDFEVACPETKPGTVISFSENTQNVNKSQQFETK